MFQVILMRSQDNETDVLKNNFFFRNRLKKNPRKCLSLSSIYPNTFLPFKYFKELILNNAEKEKEILRWHYLQR